MKIESHPQYSVFKAAVQQDDVEAMRALYPDFELRKMSFPMLSNTALVWAAEAGAMLSFEELLSSRWQAPPRSEGVMVEVFKHAQLEESAEHLFPTMVQLLVKAGVPLQSPDYGQQPLVMAARAQNFKLMKALLEAGADPDGLYRWKQGNRGAHEAPPICLVKKLDLVDLLLKHGASTNASPPLSGQGVFGGVYLVLVRWPSLSELGDLWDIMESHGVSGRTLVEGYRKEGVTFSPVAVEEKSGKPSGWPEGLVLRDLGGKVDVALASVVFEEQPSKETSERRERIQEVLVSKGFDLNGLASDGRTWLEHVWESGSRRLAMAVDLERRLPAPNARGPKPRF